MYHKKSQSYAYPSPINQIFVVLIITACFQAFFASFPNVDIWLSSIFYEEGQGFALSRSHTIKLVRDICNVMITGFGVIAFISCIVACLGYPTAGIPARVWGFISALYLLGPVILVNGVLKANSGRARPVHIEEFGGERIFTPAFEFTDQCVSNCSFVSGEASGSTAFLISIFLVTAFIGQRKWRLTLRISAAGIALACTAFRILLGRHFL
ncbi:MAG: phosphatase PAP2 family protein, partial [Halocynthiibacter sp.]